MREINCYIPIKLRLVGELSEAQLEELGQILARTLQQRLAFAERTLLSAHAGLGYSGDREVVREDYDPSREDVTGQTYTLPSYREQGQPAGVQLRTPLRGRPWFIRRAINFHAYVGQFLEDFLGYINTTYGREPMSGTEVYIDLFDQKRWVSAWLVQVNRPLWFESELLPILFERAKELSRVQSNQLLYFGWGVGDNIRAKLIEIDQDAIVAREIPSLARNDRLVKYVNGQAHLLPGAWVLFASMVLPIIKLKDFAEVGLELQVTMALRDLSFLITPALFERRHRFSWESYIQEFGDTPVIVHLQPVTLRRRLHVIALEYLVEQMVDARIRSDPGWGADSVYYGRLYVLNDDTLSQFPPPVRDSANGLTNDVTRHLNKVQIAGDLEPNWKTAYIWAPLTISQASIQAARYRPEARRLTALLIIKLQGDPRDKEWGADLLKFLHDHHPLYDPLFEYVLEELERQQQFNLLFDKVEASGHFGLHQYLVQLALATRYTSHNRVRQSFDVLNRFVTGWRNTYKVPEQEIWLDQKPDRRLRAAGPKGDVLADFNSTYSDKQKRTRLKPVRQPEFKQALEDEGKALFGRILRGEDTNQYDEESFAKEVLSKAIQRIHLTQDDFEEVTVERSVRVRSVEQHIEEALVRYHITINAVERVKGEREWVDVPGTERRVRESDFEMMLFGWELGKTADVLEAIGIGISVVGLIAFAWEAGLIAILVEAAGGSTAVLVSISISELIYIYRVVFRNAELTLGGFLMAALDGYLMALFFRGAGILGRGISGVIGKASVERLIGGWIAKQLVVGTVGGGGSAALITFSHDLIGVLSGRGGWSDLSTYIHNMALGALLGTVFEFGAPALQAILKPGLQSAAELLPLIRGAGISPARWAGLMTEALSSMRQRFETLFESAAAGKLTQIFRERIAQITEQIGAEYRLSIFQRVLELTPESMTRSAVEGLEKFLRASRTDLTNEAALAILNRLNATQLRSFLESLTLLDNSMISALSRAGHLDTLATMPQLAGVIHADPVIANMLLSTTGLPAGEAAARMRGILGVARSLSDVPESASRGAFFARGGTSQLFEVTGRPDLLVKLGGGRLPVEAQSMIELEMMGIDTVYAATRRVEGQTNIVVRRIDGVSSKDIIGRTRQPLRTPEHTELVTQRTIDDLERIYQRLVENRANVGDFQFIVRRSDGAVFVNDPVSVTRGAGPSGNIRNIIERFKRILRDNQAAGGR